jgi:hypothetical protein
MRHFVIVAAAAGLAACGQSGNEQAANQAASAPVKEKTPYCFFKDSDAKGWAASTDKDGNVVVKGKLYRQDPRYKAVLEKPKVEGATAEVWPNIAQNDTGFAVQDDWWDANITIPGSVEVTKVNVHCGAKILATIDVKKRAK